MARKIVVTSGKGGTGKTTVAANLAARLSKKGQRVILCDADFGLNNVDVVTGVENCVLYDVVDVIEGRCRAKQALVKHPEYGNLYILASCHSAPERYVSPQSLRLVLDSLSATFDFIVIDSPAGIDEGFHRAVSCAEEAIVVTTPAPCSVRDADKAIGVLKSYSLRSTSLVVNRVREDLLRSKKILTPREIAALLKIPLIGVLPDDDALSCGLLADKSKAFRALSEVVLGTKKRRSETIEKEHGEAWNFFKRGKV